MSKERSCCAYSLSEDTDEPWLVYLFFTSHSRERKEGLDDTPNLLWNVLDFRERFTITLQVYLPSQVEGVGENDWSQRGDSL